MSEYTIFKLYFDRQQSNESTIYRLILDENIKNTTISKYTEVSNRIKDINYDNFESIHSLKVFIESSPLMLSNYKFLEIIKVLNSYNEINFIQGKLINFRKYLNEEITFIEQTEELFKDKIVFTQIQINNLKTNDIDVYVKEKIKNSSFTFFIEKEIRKSFIQNYAERFQKELIVLKNSYEALFYKMKDCSIQDFLDLYLALDSKKELLSQNDVLYYHFASAYYLQLINHFKESYKRIEYSIRKIYKEMNYIKDLVPPANETMFFYKVLEHFLKSQTVKVIQIKSKEPLSKYINYIIEQVDPDFNTPIKLKIPIKIFEKINKTFYLKKIVKINKNNLPNLSHCDKKVFFSQVDTNEFSFISSYIVPEEFTFYKTFFHNFMTKNIQTIRKKSIEKDDKVSVEYYGHFLFLELFDDEVKRKDVA